MLVRYPPLPQDCVCPGVSNSGTTRMPLRRANSITIFTSAGVYTCVYGWKAPCEQDINTEVLLVDCDKYKVPNIKMLHVFAET